MNQEQRLFMGRLGKNPDLRYTMKREPVCYFTVAEKIQNQETPVWHNVVVWGRQAEQCSVYLKKGQFVFVQGQNHEREFKSKTGEIKKLLEVRASLIGFPNL